MVPAQARLRLQGSGTQGAVVVNRNSPFTIVLKRSRDQSSPSGSGTILQLEHYSLGHPGPFTKLRRLDQRARLNQLTQVHPGSKAKAHIRSLFAHRTQLGGSRRVLLSRGQRGSLNKGRRHPLSNGGVSLKARQG